MCYWEVVTVPVLQNRAEEVKKRRERLQNGVEKMPTMQNAEVFYSRAVAKRDSDILRTADIGERRRNETPLYKYNEREG